MAAAVFVVLLDIRRGLLVQLRVPLVLQADTPLKTQVRTVCRANPVCTPKKRVVLRVPRVLQVNTRQQRKVGCRVPTVQLGRAGRGAANASRGHTVDDTILSVRVYHALLDFINLLVDVPIVCAAYLEHMPKIKDNLAA